MALLDRCGNCGSIDVMPGLNTVQCLRCGHVTRNDGVVRAPDGRFTATIHDKHQQMAVAGTPHDVPVESDISGYEEVTYQDQPLQEGDVHGSGEEVGPVSAAESEVGSV